MKLRQNLGKECALRILIWSSEGHLADIYAGSQRCRRPVIWASDSSRNIIVHCRVEGLCTFYSENWELSKISIHFIQDCILVIFVQLIQTGFVLLLLPLSTGLDFTLYKDTGDGRAATSTDTGQLIIIWVLGTEGISYYIRLWESPICHNSNFFDGHVRKAGLQEL